MTSGGWFVRGTGTNLNYETLVIPLGGEQGVRNGPCLTNLYAHMPGTHTHIYHLNATNTAAQNIPTNRLVITNAVAAFGSRYGGSPLYAGQNYELGAYGGTWDTPGAAYALCATVVNRANGTFNGIYYFPIPIPQDATAWNAFVANGLRKSVSCRD